MSNQPLKDKRRRDMMARFELKRLEYKATCQDINLSSSVRSKYLLKLSQLPRNSSRVRIRNRCMLTGRPRAVYKQFRISRIVFRELASQGALLGIYKACW